MKEKLPTAKSSVLPALPVAEGEQLELEIIDLAHEGLGVAKVGGYPLFIEDALPREVVLAEVTKTGKSYGYGRVMKHLKTSPHRVGSLEPVPDIGLLRTGVAPLIHLDYSEQLKFKQRQVTNALARIAKMPDVPVLDMLGMEQPFRYRNKASVPVRMVDGQLETGFFKRGSHKLTPVDDFYINDSVIDEVISKLRSILRELKVSAYDAKRQRGDVRHIVVRRGHYSHELMIVLVTRTERLSNEKQLIARVLKEIPELTALIQNGNPQKGSAILGKKSRVLYGEPTITDRLLSNTYQISAQSFYQVNTAMAEVLYQAAIGFADLNKDDIAIDAYCGIGTIGQSFARGVHHVYGVDSVREAISDARENAQLNGIENVSYVQGSAEKVMRTWTQEGISPSVIFVDPPRKGLAKSFIEAASATAASRIIYLSCNPATFARDVALFAGHGFQPIKVQPVDMFPHTPHVECVGLLVRR